MTDLISLAVCLLFALAGFVYGYDAGVKRND